MFLPIRIWTDAGKNYHIHKLRIPYLRNHFLKMSGSTILLLILLAAGVGLGVFVWRNNIRSWKGFTEKVKETPERVKSYFTGGVEASAPVQNSILEGEGVASYVGRGRRRHRYY